MSASVEIIPAALRARLNELLAKRSDAMGSSWAEVAETEDAIAAVCDELADALFSHDLLLGRLALAARGHFRNEAAESRDLAQFGDGQ